MPETGDEDSQESMAAAMTAAIVKGLRTRRTTSKPLANQPDVDKLKCSGDSKLLDITVSNRESWRQSRLILIMAFMAIIVSTDGTISLWDLVVFEGMMRTPPILLIEDQLFGPRKKTELEAQLGDMSLTKLQELGIPHFWRRDAYALVKFHLQANCPWQLALMAKAGKTGCVAKWFRHLDDTYLKVSSKTVREARKLLYNSVWNISVPFSSFLLILEIRKANYEFEASNGPGVLTGSHTEDYNVPPSEYYDIIITVIQNATDLFWGIISQCANELRLHHKDQLKDDDEGRSLVERFVGYLREEETRLRKSGSLPSAKQSTPTVLLADAYTIEPEDVQFHPVAMAAQSQPYDQNRDQRHAHQRERGAQRQANPAANSSSNTSGNARNDKAPKKRGERTRPANMRVYSLKPSGDPNLLTIKMFPADQLNGESRPGTQMQGVARRC
jgi:hypothetical protein